MAQKILQKDRRLIRSMRKAIADCGELQEQGKSGNGPLGGQLTWRRMFTDYASSGHGSRLMIETNGATTVSCICRLLELGIWISVGPRSTEYTHN